MARSGQDVPTISFAVGMDQSMGPRGAQPGTLYDVRNGRVVNGELQKRPRLEEITGTTSAPTIIRMTGNGTTNDLEGVSFAGMINGEPCLGTTAGAIFTMDRSSVGEVFHFQGRFGSCKPLGRRAGLIGSMPGEATYTEKPAATAINSAGYVAYAAVSDTGTAATIVIENPQGLRLLQHTISAVKVQLVAVGTAFYVVYQTTIDTVDALPLTPDGTDVNFGSAATVATLASAAHHWDTSSYNSTNWQLVSQTGASTMTWEVMSGTASVRTTTFSVTGTCPVSIFGENYGSGNVWIGWYNDPTVSGNVRYRVYTNNGVQVKGETTLISAADVYGPPLFGRYRDPLPGNGSLTTQTFCIIRYVEAAGNLLRATLWTVAFSDGNSPSTPQPIWGVLPISKPDNFNRFWAFTDNGGTNFQSQRAALLRVTEVGNPPVVELVSPAMPGVLGASGPAGSAAYFHAIATGSDTSHFAFPFILASTDDGLIGKIEVYEYETSAQDPFAIARSLGPLTAISGQPVQLPGVAAPQTTAAGFSRVGGSAEIGFLHPPVIISAANGGTAGTGTHSWRATYEWADTAGNRHRSAPSPPFTLTNVNASVDVDFEISTLQVSLRSASDAGFTVVITLWRTLNGGTTYHRAKTLDGIDTTNGFNTVTDAVQDSTLADEEILYTDGGVLDNDIAPSCRFMAFAEDALWLGGLWDRRVIQRSKLLIPGEPIQCTDHGSHQVILPKDCTGIAYLDGQVVGFAEDEIYAFGGDGPNDQGVGSFTPPRRLAQGIGCIDYRSIIETNVGILFQSKRGIELLPRGFGAVQHIGAAVRDYAQGAIEPSQSFSGQLPCIASATLTTNTGNYARFLVGTTAGASSGTRTFTYDIERGIWFVDDYAYTLGVLAAWHDGRFVHVNSSLSSEATGPIWLESDAAAGDGTSGNTHVSTSITSTWQQPWGVFGWGKVSRIGIAFVVIGNCTVALGVTTDDGATNSGAWAVTTADAGNRIQYRELFVAQRSCTAFQITVSDTATSGTPSAGIKLLGWTMELTTEGGTRRLASGERA